MIVKIKCLCLVLAILHLASGYNLVDGSSVGVCYGIQANSLPMPREVVSMYKTHHIEKMRLYEPNHNILNSLRKSGIEVLVGIKNEDIRRLANSYSVADKWVEVNIKFYWPEVRFRYIVVGNEAIPGKYAHFVLPAMLNLYNALTKWRLEQHIDVSTVVSTSVLGVSSPPSASAFSKDSLKYMIPITRFLSSIGAPLLANIHPYFRYIKDRKRTPIRYALFQSTMIMVRDGNFEYQNLFDEMMDTIYISLEKIGASNVSLVVSETGWPSIGDSSYANQEFAELYYKNVIKHVLSSRGTPRKPGKIETYLYAMFDEDKKRGTDVKRYWGVFEKDKTLFYHIKFNKE